MRFWIFVFVFLTACGLGGGDVVEVYEEIHEEVVVYEVVYDFVSSLPVPRGRPGVFTVHNFFNLVDGAHFQYQFHQPSALEPGRLYPIFVFLPGGANYHSILRFPEMWQIYWVNELTRLINAYPEIYESYVIIPAIPDLGPEPYQVMELISYLIDYEFGDPERVYFMGVSMGAFVITDLIRRYPDVAAGVILLCGASPFSAVDAFNTSHIPMRIYHSDDDYIVHVNISRVFYNGMILAGAENIEFFERTGFGHAIWEYAYEQDILQWMFSQTRNLPRVTEEPVHSGIHGFLSRIEHENNVAYMLGSFHYGRAHWFPIHPMVYEVMERADVFAFEADYTRWEDEDYIERYLEYALLPEGQTLRDVLSAESFNLLYESIYTFPHIDFDDIENLTPAYAASVVGRSMTWRYNQVFSNLSVDLYIMDFAQERDRPIIGLNCIFSELNFALYWPQEIWSIAFEGITDYETLVANIRENAIADAYERQDAESIYAAVIVPMHEDTQIYGQFRLNNLKERCRIFAAEIERLLVETEEPTTFFITIGAAHLLKGYIFEILENNGLEVVALGTTDV